MCLDRGIECHMLVYDFIEVADLRKCLAANAVKLAGRIVDRLPDIRKTGDPAEETVEFIIDLESFVDVMPLRCFLLAKDQEIEVLFRKPD